VIVDYLDLGWATPGPDETQTKLVVDSNAVLPFAVAPQRFELVSGRRPEKCERFGRVELGEFANSDVLNGTKATRIAAREKRSCVSAAK
jgi:hypothetical protein